MGTKLVKLRSFFQLYFFFGHLFKTKKFEKWKSLNCSDKVFLMKRVFDSKYLCNEVVSILFNLLDNVCDSLFIHFSNVVLFDPIEMLIES